MTTLHAGTVLEGVPGPKYRKALRFAELRPSGPIPKRATLTRWREEVGADFTFSWVTPTAALRSSRGPLRVDDAMERALATTIDAAIALDARFVVVPTSADVTTGQRDRDLLAAWVERWARAGRQLVWQPAGLWDPEIALPFARHLGVVLGFDPLEADPPPGAIAYGRLRAMGQRSRFSETLLLEVLDRLEGAEAEDAWIAIDSPKSFTEAQRLAALAAE